MERPPGVSGFVPSPHLFPFTSRWFDSEVGPVHYVDEGEGRPLLLLHGNPTWSFLYRGVVRVLRQRFRCVAPDYPGFGLSAHPDAYGYTPAEHAEVVRALVQHLDLRDVVVVGQDWGGPVGADVATRDPGRVGGVVMANTWCWPADDLVMRGFSTVMSSPPAQWAIRHHNAFVDPLMRRTLQARLSATEMAHYRDVLPTARARRGVAELPRQIRAARPWLAGLAERVGEAWADLPVLLVWGPRDPAFGRESVLRRWRSLVPHATVVRLPAAGHYVPEDAPDALAAAVLEHLGPDSGSP